MGVSAGYKIEEVLDLWSLPVIREVTNIAGLNPNFMKDIGVARVRQVSDAVIRKKVDSILSILKKEQDFLEDFHSEAAVAAFNESYRKILSSADNCAITYEECVIELLAFVRSIDVFIEI